ncbi:MAG: hypothetical protein KDB70_05345 [Mycobacterium sp.]|nr:hypothetical protein [Mycobacterium sp.]
MGVIGCTVMTDGTATPNAADAPVFRTSMSRSASASAATSSALAAERAATSTTKAIHAVCETLATGSADAVSAVNTYVSAVNGDGDVEAAKQPAVDALNNSADNVEKTLSDPVTGDLRDALTAWVTASRATATAITTDAAPADFNTAVDQVNTTRKRALELCDATYR